MIQKNPLVVTLGMKGLIRLFYHATCGYLLNVVIDDCDEGGQVLLVQQL